jgi:hypothetical protein
MIVKNTVILFTLTSLLQYVLYNYILLMIIVITRLLDTTNFPMKQCAGYKQI